VEVTLDRLDMVFTIPTRTGDVLIRLLRRGGRQGGHHKAWVVASGHHFSFEDDPPWLGPGPCSIGKLGTLLLDSGVLGFHGVQESSLIFKAIEK
jgi:hypothetical protein